MVDESLQVAVPLFIALAQCSIVVISLIWLLQLAHTNTMLRLFVYGDFCKGVLPGFFRVCVKVFFCHVHAHQAFTHNLHKTPVQKPASTQTHFLLMFLQCWHCMFLGGFCATSFAVQ